ncbi:hypothetical protein Syun_017217 [Stephania yunnanensis]|uniref:Uncharacterized protein n=1 Tax=Stephania yunnanensis TaxID=152371 RepID=A0AAP0J7G0_9MAGN
MKGLQNYRFTSVFFEFYCKIIFENGSRMNSVVTYLDLVLLQSQSESIVTSLVLSDLYVRHLFKGVGSFTGVIFPGCLLMIQLRFSHWICLGLRQLENCLAFYKEVGKFETKASQLGFSFLELTTSNICRVSFCEIVERRETVCSEQCFCSRSERRVNTKYTKQNRLAMKPSLYYASAALHSVKIKMTSPGPSYLVPYDFFLFMRPKAQMRYYSDKKRAIIYERGQRGCLKISQQFYANGHISKEWEKVEVVKLCHTKNLIEILVFRKPRQHNMSWSFVAETFVYELSNFINRVIMDGVPLVCTKSGGIVLLCTTNVMLTHGTNPHSGITSKASRILLCGSLRKFISMSAYISDSNSDVAKWFNDLTQSNVVFNRTIIKVVIASSVMFSLRSKGRSSFQMPNDRMPPISAVTLQYERVVYQSKQTLDIVIYFVLLDSYNQKRFRYGINAFHL